MKWVSTRRASPAVPFIDALFAGTAPDGGLYFPERFDPLPAATVRPQSTAPDVGLCGTTAASIGNRTWAGWYGMLSTFLSARQVADGLGARAFSPTLASVESACPGRLLSPLPPTERR